MNRLWLVPVLLLAACGSTGVVPTDDGAYMIAQRSPQAGMGPPVAAQAEVYQEANTFCSSRQKQLETIKLDVTNSGFAKPGSVTLIFRCK